jgi:Carbon starvation protein, predicted membrane protein
MIGTTAAQAAQVISGWGFTVTPDMISQIAQDVGEKTLLSRTGGAPTLAVGMAHILSGMFGGRALMGLWYHFAILFEALFILTTVDAGTRVARFMIQDMIGSVVPSFRKTESWGNNLVGSALAVGAWGYFLYQGVIDPMGGINTLWPLFGISNQMLAGIALILCTVVLFKMKRQRYAWVTIVPTLWLLVCTLTAGYRKSSAPNRRSASLPTRGCSATPPRRARSWRREDDRRDAPRHRQRLRRRYTSALFVMVVVAMIVYGVIAIRRALGDPKITAIEIGLPANIPGANLA